MLSVDINKTSLLPLDLFTTWKEMFGNSRQWHSHWANQNWILNQWFSWLSLVYLRQSYFQWQLFPLWDAPAGNHGSCIHHLGLDVCLVEYNYHDLLQARLTFCIWGTFHSLQCNDFAVSIVYIFEKYKRTVVLISSSFVSLFGVTVLFPERWLAALSSDSCSCPFPMFSFTPTLSTALYVLFSLVTSVTVVTFSAPAPAAWGVCNYEVAVSNMAAISIPLELWEPEVDLLPQVRPQ